VAAEPNRRGHACNVGLSPSYARSRVEACQSRRYKTTTVPGEQPVTGLV
jgi:hypothetical protein